MADNNKRIRKPSSVSEAYSILGGYKSGDTEGAQSFLDNMSETERILRGRGEQREKGKLRMFSKKSRFPSLLKKAKQRGYLG